MFCLLPCISWLIGLCRCRHCRRPVSVRMCHFCWRQIIWRRKRSWLPSRSLSLSREISCRKSVRNCWTLLPNLQSRYITAPYQSINQWVCRFMKWPKVLRGACSLLMLLFFNSAPRLFWCWLVLVNFTVFTVPCLNCTTVMCAVVYKMGNFVVVFVRKLHSCRFLLRCGLLIELARLHFCYFPALQNDTVLLTLVNCS